MRRRTDRRRLWATGLSAGIGLALAGCHTTQPAYFPPPPGSVPAELHKVTLPAYVVEPPDVVLIEVKVTGRDLGDPPVDLEVQPIGGQHLVRPDGTVGLGVYGSVPLAGLTLNQAQELVRAWVAKVAGKKPEELLVVVDVVAYNSKFFYVIADNATDGQQVYQIPITGSETVLDGIGKINGLPVVASQKNIWVARRTAPQPGVPCADQILPVDWCAITQHGDANSNYQLLPGDRIFVNSQKLYKLDNVLRKVYSPIERTFGVILLGATTVNAIQGQQGGGNNAGF